MRIFHLPVSSPRDLAKSSNVVGGCADGSFDGNGDFSRFANLCVRHLKRCRSEFGAVEFLGELAQRAIPVFPHRFNNVRSLLEDSLIKQARRLQHFGNLRVEAFVLVRIDFHRRARLCRCLLKMQLFKLWRQEFLELGWEGFLCCSLCDTC